MSAVNVGAFQSHENAILIRLGNGFQAGSLGQVEPLQRARGDIAYHGPILADGHRRARYAQHELPEPVPRLNQLELP